MEKTIVKKIHVLFIAVALTGCASAVKRSTPVYGPPVPGDSSATTSNEPMGPPENLAEDAAGAPEEKKIPAYGPEPEKVRPLVLVFGPGLARTFAAAGVLRALNEAKISVGAIFATEMSSVFAAVYGFSSNSNQFEWALMRFRPEHFAASAGLLANLLKLKEPTALEKEINKFFGDKDLRQSRIPIRLAVEKKNSGAVVFAEQGRVADVLRAAIAAPELMKEGVFEGVPAISAERSRPFAVQEARALDLGPVVVVDFSDPRLPLENSELSQADLIIRPKLGSVEVQNFARANEAAYRGKEATAAKVGELRKLISSENARVTESFGE